MYNDMLEDSGQVNFVSECDIVFKALPSGFFKENTYFMQGAKSLREYLFCARVICQVFVLFPY